MKSDGSMIPRMNILYFVDDSLTDLSWHAYFRGVRFKSVPRYFPNTSVIAVKRENDRSREYVSSGDNPTMFLS